MKKILSAGLLCLCLIMALLPATVWADQADLNWTEFVTSMPESGYLEDEAGNVSISTAAGLAWLASLVNGLNGQTAADFSGRTISLTAAIDLAGHDWIPIGQVTKAFAGSFDGKSKSISNMSVNLSPDDSGDAVYAGLFGVTAQAGLHNIILDGTAAISGDAGKNYAGGIVAYLAGGSVTNSNSSVDVSIAAGSNQENYAGGIAGYNQGGTIDGASKLGRLEIYTLMVGDSGDTTDPGNTPGPGSFDDLYFPDITNNFAGGIVGVNNSGLIKNSSAYELISATGKNSWNYAGGLAGYNVDGAIVANSYNTAPVAATGQTLNRAGGLVGANENAHLANSYNTGPVSAAGGDSFTGGAAGTNERGIVANSYWLETTAAQACGQGSASSCAGFSQAQGKGLETTPSFKYTVGTAKERTGSLVMALNAWVKKPSLAATSYSYQTWTNVEDDKPGYPVFGTPAPGEAAADLPDQPGETLPLPTDPDLPQTGASTSKPLVPILLILAGLSSLSLTYYRKKTHA